MRIEIVPSLLNLPWSLDSFGREPFASPDFYKLFEQAKVVGPESGWSPLYFIALEDNEVMGLLPAYIKTNSFGEFIFDWAWADLYQRNGIPYYPKLTMATPFSPVNTSKIFHKNEQAKTKLISAFCELFESNKVLSSAHALFTTDSENKALKERGFFVRKTIQYHLELDYTDFAAYLGALKARKRKQIKKERAYVAQSGLSIEIIDKAFTDDLMSTVYELYLTTIDKKWSQAYLNHEFFLLLGREWARNLVIAVARDEKGIAAMSLFLKSSEALYGRYWGARPDVDIPYLHFELSYYQGIDYCVQHGIKLFEAGAQGEQKLLRGFAPVEISSCHKLSLEPMHQAIEHHIKMENAYTEDQIRELERHLPYKKKEI